MKHSATQNAGWQTVAVRAAANTRLPDEFMEHRWGRRRPCVARVCVSAGGGIAGSGRLRNVSMSGAFLESALPLPLFGQVALSVLRDDGSRYGTEITATVVRRDTDGVGLEWNETAAGPICRLLGCAAVCSAFQAELG